MYDLISESRSAELKAVALRSYMETIFGQLSRRFDGMLSTDLSKLQGPEDLKFTNLSSKDRLRLGFIKSFLDRSPSASGLDEFTLLSIYRAVEEHYGKGFSMAVGSTYPQPVTPGQLERKLSEYFYARNFDPKKVSLYFAESGPDGEKLEVHLDYSNYNRHGRRGLIGYSVPRIRGLFSWPNTIRLTAKLQDIFRSFNLLTELRGEYEAKKSEMFSQDSYEKVCELLGSTMEGVSYDNLTFPCLLEAKEGVSYRFVYSRHRVDTESPRVGYGVTTRFCEKCSWAKSISGEGSATLSSEQLAIYEAAMVEADQIVRSEHERRCG